MTPQSKSCPKGFHTVTPTLTVRDAGKAIDFYKRAFGAEERMRFPAPDRKSIMHAEIKIGDSIIFLSDERPEMGCRGPQSLGGTPVGFFLYVEDVDQAFDRAVSAGSISEGPVSDMFWGDRCGQLTDPFGHKWTLATHKEDLTMEEIGKRAQGFFAEKMAGQAR
jgi:uncharacterized glyoxalase superfamily protein PhnB